MELDLKVVPFSRYGSYYAITEHEGELCIRDFHGGDECSSLIWKMEILKDNEAVDYKVLATETKFTCYTDAQEKVEIVFGEEELINIKCTGLSVKLICKKSKYDSFFKLADNLYNFDNYTKETKMLFSVQTGAIEVDAPWDLIGNEKLELTLSGDCYLVIEGYKVTYKNRNYESFETYEKKVVSEYHEWVSKFAKQDSESTKLASYIMWSAVVHPLGMLKHYAMYMSKNGMHNIWSWDNVFNAMALAESFPELALAQFEIFFDYQDESGIFPDRMNDKFISYSCVKPPIYAWAFEIVRSKNEYFNNKEVLEKVYKSIKGQTSFWLNFRTLKENTLPVYFHGNDSGWDNASIFHEGMPVEAPDLAAHLIKQMDILAKMAEELGYQEDVIYFEEQANAMFELLMKKLYKDGQFVAVMHNSQKYIDNKESLILRLPIIIGYRLGKEVSDKIVRDLEENFLVTYGFTTEKKSSELYKTGGYWLGPIWGAPTFMLYDALKNLGYTSLAEKVKSKFIQLVAVGGMSENFDAFTGESYSDPAFTWTSGIYILLSKE